MKTASTKSDQITRKWHYFDARNEILGRLASQIAIILMGKNKTNFVHNLDTSDHVVVINASEVKVTGRKEENKKYYHHSGYPGGMKILPLNSVRNSHPERILRHAVSGMLPKNKLQDKLLKHLHIYPNSNHPYTKQFKKDHE